MSVSVSMSMSVSVSVSVSKSCFSMSPVGGPIVVKQCK